MGFTLNYFLSSFVEQSILANFAAAAVPAQNQLITSQLDLSDFRSSNSLESPRFNKFVKKRVFSTDIVFMKIWNRNGTILWSNTKKLIGQTFKPKGELQSALAGNRVYEVTDLRDVENVSAKPKFNQLLEIYSPIRINGKTVGAYEVYYSLDPVIIELAKIRQAIAGSITVGLGILYILLFGLVKRASDTIDGQNKRLRKMTGNLTDSMKDLKSQYVGTLLLLEKTLSARDHKTSSHSHRLENITRSLGDQLGLGAEQHQEIEYGCQLHDIGKIGVTDRVLQKKGRLTREEFDEIKEHPQIGADIVRSVPFLKDAAEVIEHHHEWFDGSGYPSGLSGTAIPIVARDTFSS